LAVLVGVAALTAFGLQDKVALPTDCALESALQLSGPLSRPQLDALRANNIEAAARVTGAIVDTLPTEGTVTTLSVLAGKSTAVLVGTVVDSACYLQPGGRVITTLFRVRIAEAVKGDLKKDEDVLVQERGGRRVFTGGAVAETRVHSREPMKRGSRYVLFLRPSLYGLSAEASAAASGRPVLMPTYGGYSVFELANDGKVVPALTVPFGNNVSTDNRGRPVGEFLAQIRALGKS
jgi:hypothetical protein